MSNQSYGALVTGGSFAGVDQGIDFTGGPFNVLALGEGVVERVVPTASGWAGDGGLVTYRITSGPLAGRHVYAAEDLTPEVRVGQPLHAGEVIALATGSGHAPGIEVGFADAQGHAYGHAFPRQPQQQGYAFQSAVEALSRNIPFPQGSTVGPVPPSGPSSPAGAPPAPVDTSGSGIIGGSIEELFIRLLQLVLGLVLLWIGARQLGSALLPSARGLLAT